MSRERGWVLLSSFCVPCSQTEYPNSRNYTPITESIRLTSKAYLRKLTSVRRFVSASVSDTNSYLNTDYIQVRITTRILVIRSVCVILCHKSPISDRIQLRGTRERRGLVSYFIKRETTQKGTFHLCGHSRL